MRKAWLWPATFALAMLSATVSAGAEQKIVPPPQISYGAPLSLDQAKKIMAAAELEAKKIGLGVVIIVLDSGGHVVMLHRLDGAQLGSIEAAKDKAHSAVFFRRPTKVFQDRLADGGINLRLLQLSGANVIEGGLPIIVDSKIIGGVGVSGGLVGQDTQIAKAGISALMK
jgi:glc operon protein GlcG